MVSDEQLGTNFKGSEAISKRLDALNYILNGTPKDLSSFNTPSPLAELSCLDIVRSLEEIDQCISVGANYKKEWAELLKFRYNLALMRIIAGSKSLTQGEKTLRLSKLIEEFGSTDPFTGFDYSNEYKFYRLIVFQRGDVEAAAKKMLADTPNFSPQLN